MGVSIFYRRCPATSRFLASYPATPSGAEPTALVPVAGTCVPHSQSQGGTAPRMHCNSEGDWMVPVGGCTCDAGYEPNQNGSACLALSIRRRPTPEHLFTAALRPPAAVLPDSQDSGEQQEQRGAAPLAS
ncbi:hypothetical protein NFI96_006732 [Prochilodus magdalenae]|nr:hypothetical protein NFI96_006732 [Prochilodus magdalenae]